MYIYIYGISSATWKDEEHIAFAEMDTWGKPGAVGYNQPMKWGTAASFIDMGIDIQVMIYYHISPPPYTYTLYMS